LDNNLQISCLRCGICCTGHEVRIELIEAHRIADFLAIDFSRFLTDYTDTSWPGTHSLLIKTISNKCAFLMNDSDSLTSCRINFCKPFSCSAWNPSIYRKECKQGLLRVWNISVSETGELKGTTEDVGRFIAYQKAIGKDG